MNSQISITELARLCGGDCAMLSSVSRPLPGETFQLLLERELDILNEFNKEYLSCRPLSGGRGIAGDPAK